MLRRILFTALLLSMISLQNPAFSADPQSSPGKTVESCRAITDAMERLHCFEDVTSARPPQLPPAAKAGDGWRLVRTPGPVGAGHNARAQAADDVISMMRTADLLRSDPDFAGLTLHCGQTRPEILIIVVEPFPPRAKPQVTLGGPINQVRFEASVLPSGAALLLPEAAMALANGVWQSQIDLPVKIVDGDRTVRGVVPLTGLNAALRTLKASCPSH